MVRIFARPPVLFLSANLLLVGLVLANIMVVENYVDPGGAHSRDVTQGDVSVLRHTVYVAPGNVLRLPPMWAFNMRPTNYVSFYIVEGGQGQAPSGTEPGSAYLYGSESEFVAGRTPPLVYYTDSAPVAIDPFDFRRPSPPESKPHFEPEGWSPSIDEYESLDLVWVYDRSLVPAGDLGLANGVWRRATSGTSDVWGDHPFAHPMEISGFWLDAQPFIFGLQILGVLIVLATGAFWYRSARTGPDAVRPGPTEGLVQLANTAEGYLRHLRQLGLLNGVLLVLGGFFGIVVANYYTSSGGWWTYPTPSWNSWVLVFLVIAYVGLIAMWFVHYRRLAAEFRRVRTQLAQPPLVA